MIINDHRQRSRKTPRPTIIWLFFLVLLCQSLTALAKTGTWQSAVTGGYINFTTTESSKPLKDASGSYFTVVYLEKLGFDKIGQNTNAEDVAWLLAKGYRVIKLDYDNHSNAISPKINDDIIKINDEIASGSFCGYSNSSGYRSYILFEGYRIARDVSYFKDNPTVYNTSTSYIDGDSLHMDIIYPANASTTVPIVLSFSYSNSYPTNKDQRVNLGYTFAGFNDSFLEGAPAAGIAWAIADHPKYCPWGGGKPTEGANDTYKSYQANPDAAQKVKSAVRTLRILGESLGLSGKIGIYGFSRGSDAGSMAVGDLSVAAFENAGLNIGTSDDVQAAALGSGVFDFTQIYNSLGDGDSNLETRCPWAWGPLSENYELWQSMGSANLVRTSASAPVLFFYNTDDSHYYQDQIKHFKSRLDAIGVPTSSIINYGKGHAVPQTTTALSSLYRFFNQYLSPSGFTPVKKDSTEICVVTADLETGKNMVVWERKNGFHIKEYKIYRTPNQGDTYEFLGAVSNNEISVFVDETSNPGKMKYRYRISMVDSLDQESAPGNFHQPILLNYTNSQFGASLIWESYHVENKLINFTTIEIYRGKDSTQLEHIATVPAHETEYRDLDSLAYVARMYYRVGGVKIDACSASFENQSDSETYLQSVSNLVTNGLSEPLKKVKTFSRNTIELNVSPNPATDKLEVEFKMKRPEAVQISICNIAGEMIYSSEKEYFKSSIQNEIIWLDDLNPPKGIYYVLVKGKSTQEIQRFIKM